MSEGPEMSTTAKRLCAHLSWQRDKICQAAGLDPVEYHIRARSEAGGAMARVEFYQGELDRVAVADCFWQLQRDVIRWAALQREKAHLSVLQEQMAASARRVRSQELRVRKLEDGKAA
ncbi:MAG: hypothetical protein Q7Q73_03360 [Verrucomicrobiota bacterium JB024]|nr:hypothetical protein [Verrucomicrobiota bacterium JB024]